jgi:hypothetical protein
MSSAYPISSPVEFTNTTGGDSLIFNASTTKNKVVDFVVTSPGDILYRNSTGTSNVLERLAIGDSGQVLSVSGIKSVQVNKIIVAAAAAGVNNSYFLIDSPTSSYYVWYNLSGTGIDPILTIPTPPDLLVDNQLRIAIPVAVVAAATIPVVGDATALAINAISEFSAPPPAVAGEVVVTNVLEGLVSIPIAGIVPPTTFTYSITTPGVSALPAWTSLSPISTSSTFLAEGTVVGSAIAAGSTWVTISSTQLTWDDSTLPNSDAGNNFDITTGEFTVSSTGVYTISASITFQGNATGNGGGGITGRRAIRQARIFNTTTASSMAFKSEQAQSNNENPTQISLVVAAVSLTLSDVLVLQARHDASSSITLDVNEDDVPTQGPSTYFSSTRIV